MIRRHNGKVMKQQMIVWSIVVFGLFIACFVGIIMNPMVGNSNNSNSGSNGKSKPESEPEEEEEELSEELLKLLHSVPNETTMPKLIPTQNCHFATSEGRRLYQEDQVTCDIDLKFPLLGRDGLEEVTVGAVAVFDGHIGYVASEMASNVFLDKFMLKLNSSIEQYSKSKELLKSSLVTTINDIDAEFSKVALERDIYSGSTAVVALIYSNHVLVANVGDSKAFLCSQKNISHEAGAASLGGLLAKELTRDHNAHRLDERARIEASGGVLTFFGNFTPLLNGHFPMTRAIGDVPLKRFGIIADPEITDWLSLTSTDKFLVVSSDGIFESITPQGVCDFLNEVDDHSDPSLLAQQLIEKAYSKGSRDNLSVVLVPLGSREPPVDDLSRVAGSTGM